MSSSHPPMPSLIGQIVETVKANFKLLAFFALILTVIPFISELLFVGAFKPQLLNGSQGGVAEASNIIFFKVLVDIIFFFISFYCIIQTFIVATHYHQQPPHQTRKVLKMTDPEFHKNTSRYIGHSILIGFFYLAVILTFMIVFFITTHIELGLLTAVCMIVAFVVMLMLAPLTATKLPAVIDPNGDTSLNAAFRRGKSIFWRFLGVGLLSFIFLMLFLIVLVGGLWFLGTSLYPLFKDSMNIILPVGAFLGIFAFYIFNMILYTTGAVIQSHFYIMSEYYLPNKEQNINLSA